MRRLTFSALLLFLSLLPGATARADLALLNIFSAPAPLTLGADGSLAMVAPLQFLDGQNTPRNNFGSFGVSGGSLALSFGPATSGSLATGYFYAGGTITLTGNGHVLDQVTLGRTELAPNLNPDGSIAFYHFDVQPASSLLAPELAAFYGVSIFGSSLLGGNVKFIDGVLTAFNGLQTGGVVNPVPAAATPEPASLVLLAVGLAMAWRRSRERP